MRKPLLAAPVVAMLTLAATTPTLIQIVARTSPRLSRYNKGQAALPEELEQKLSR